MYAVRATYTKNLPNGYTANGQVPTFYLSERTQGIVSVEHARHIAADILYTVRDDDGVVFNIYVDKV